MIVSDEAYVMLLTRPFFKTFTTRGLWDTAKHTEGLFALSCGSRAEVDEIVKTAVAAGGRHAMDPRDHGFMYGWSFYDPDGHHWDVIWMDPLKWFCECFALIAGTASPLTRDFVRLGRVSHWGDTAQAGAELIPELRHPTLASGLSTL